MKERIEALISQFGKQTPKPNCGEKPAQYRTRVLSGERTRTDTERLEWLLRNISGSELRRLLGYLPDTGDVAVMSKRIDAAMDAETP